MDEKRFNPRRCRWVRREMYGLRQREAFLCKEMEDPPKDSKNVQTWRHIITTGIKKESPNEGTETLFTLTRYFPPKYEIKKESPNEGTETDEIRQLIEEVEMQNKKRIPE